MKSEIEDRFKIIIFCANIIILAIIGLIICGQIPSIAKLIFLIKTSLPDSSCIPVIHEMLPRKIKFEESPFTVLLIRKRIRVRAFSLQGRETGGLRECIILFSMIYNPKNTSLSYLLTPDL